MNFEEELKLSFYKEIASVDEGHGVALVQHTESGSVYVRKTLKHYDREIFEFIKEGRFRGIPVIHELIEADGELTVIEDYISGRSLDDLMSDGLFDEEETMRIIACLCDTLKPLHSHTSSIVHRDIKGSNVIIDNENNVYLIDFDASKTVTSGKNRDTDLIGTEEYAAPEQYGFGQSDQRTDIYALGVLMNKMLTGAPPAESKHTGKLTKIIRRATEIDPDNRFKDVQSLKAAIINQMSGGDSKAMGEGYGFGKAADSKLSRALSKLPYPIRELPGFRSGNPLAFITALIGYSILVAFGFFGVTSLPQYTAAQNRFYDIATFLLILMPILYIGNYLGIRDRLPWKKSAAKAYEFAELLRIGAGVILSILLVVVLVTLSATLLGF